MLKESSISLLWNTSDRESFTLRDEDINDLNISSVLDFLNKNGVSNYYELIKEVPINPEDIIYRQQILNEFITKQGLFDAIVNYVTQCYSIIEKPHFAYENEAALYNLLNRMERVAELMKLYEELYGALNYYQVQSQGLLRLKTFLQEIIDHDLYQSLKFDVTEIKSMNSGINSVKVGMNLDENLKPVSAMLLSFHDKTFTYTRLFKKTSKAVKNGIHAILSVPRRMFFPDTIAPPDDMNTLEKMMAPATKQLIGFCDQFIDALAMEIAPLKLEFPFYEAGIKIALIMNSAGFPTCQPRIVTNDKTVLESIYNIRLAFDMLERSQKSTEMVYNDLEISETGNIFIITGANRGGKTTFTQAIGQIYWFAQLGYYIPAKNATLKVIDFLGVHFPSQEHMSEDEGCLGHECKTFADIYSKLTNNSLLLMNESFSGTSHLESLAISQEVLRAIAKINVTTLFNTHLHELGDITMAFNKPDSPPLFVSLVTGTHEAHQSFKLHQGPPLGLSYADEIAKKYGMTYSQLVNGTVYN